MPINDYRCLWCKQIETRFVKLEKMCYTQLHACNDGEIGRPMEVVFLTPRMVAVDIPAYQSPVDGKVINSRKQRKEDLKRNGCVEYEPGFNEETQRNRAAAEKAEDKAIDATVEEFVEKLPTRKKEQLDSELRAGADVVINR